MTVATNTKTAVLHATISQAQKGCQFYKDGAKTKCCPMGSMLVSLIPTFASLGYER